MNDQIIYQKIGQILVSSGPSNAKKVIVRADLFRERDGCTYEFDYINKSNELNWYDPDSKAVSELTDALEELRSFYIDNIQPRKKSFWSGCEITLNLETMKINIDFKYED
ncbi:MULTISPECIES: hypothetical protein [Providencia]|uniref:hypothetical protein n=1 Tax=Providencia TaxID=586 RepID=UPI00198183A5|nr:MULTISPECIES: hypothetical protein [Providencia]MBN4865740.1 hypothetical protein [Providencia stuartii]MBN4875062.1 hypothetical protein [Providencia stuartii]MBN4879753.1 hypothetical protein [Providencia stuartii]MBN4884261.1 hypothetical protein [Providencia stuartii]